MYCTYFPKGRGYRGDARVVGRIVKVVLVWLSFDGEIVAFVLSVSIVLLGDVHPHTARPRTCVRALRTLVDTQVGVSLDPVLSHTRQEALEVAL